jgi:asparagine synthase (glutamine-hydrolysing)
MTRMPLDLRLSLYTPDFQAAVLDQPVDWLASLVRPEIDAADPINRLVDWMSTFYLPNDMLVKVDRMTMAHSLEARCPLLDHELLEFAARIPPTLKLRGWTTKYILKRTLEQFLPRDVIQRPKHGFEAPLRIWFRGNLAEVAEDVLLSTSSLSRDYFRPESVRSLISAHRAGRADHGTHLWQLLNLELWHRMFLDNAFGRLPERRVPELQQRVGR